jgi:hypothetical protein
MPEKKFHGIPARGAFPVQARRGASAAPRALERATNYTAL